MAYMSQETKKLIQAELKKVIPADWKWSLSVSDHSTLYLNIKWTPKNILRDDFDHYQMNHYYPQYSINEKFLPLMQKIIKMMNMKNWDRSEPQVDYFDIGYHIAINFGRWDKPYIYG